jgi:hypothetical protein
MAKDNIMKITKTQLRQIINEEISRLDENESTVPTQEEISTLAFITLKNDIEGMFFRAFDQKGEELTLKPELASGLEKSLLGRFEKQVNGKGKHGLMSTTLYGKLQALSTLAAVLPKT